MRRLSELSNLAADAIERDTVAFISWFKDGRILTASQPFFKMTGFTQETVEKMKWPDDFTTPETSNGIKQAMIDTDRGAEGLTQDGILVKKDGSLTPVRVFLHNYFDNKDSKPCYYSFIVDLTEHDQAQEALDFYEKKTRQYLDMAFNPILVNIGGKIAYANRKCADLLGAKTQEELIGKSIFDIIHPDYHEIEKKRNELILTEYPGVPGVHEKLIRLDGNIIDIELTTFKFLFELKPAILVIIQDITRRRQIEESMRESTKLLRIVMDNVPQRIFWKDKDSVYLGCNKNFALAAGVGTSERIVGKTDYDLAWTREQADAFRRDDREVMDNNRPKYHIIEPQRQANGTLSWLDTNKVPIHDNLGNVIGILGTYEDVTKRIKLEEELQQSRARLMKAQQIARLGNWELDLISQELYWSDEIYRIFGFEPGTIKPDTKLFISLVVPEDRQRVNSIIDALHEKNEPFKMDYKIIRRDGSVRYIHSEAEIVSNKSGISEKVFGINQDITEFRKAEESLKLTSFSLDHAKDIIFWFYPDGRLYYANNAACERYGYTREELLSRSIFDINPYYTTEIWDARWLKLRNEGSLYYETDTRAKDGSLFPIEVTINYIKYGDMELACGYARDITERKRVEDALRRSETGLKKSQEIAHLGSWELDLVNNRLTWSDEVYRIFGLQPQAFRATYEGFLKVVHPDDRAAVDAAYYDSIREGRDHYEIEHRVIRKSDGEVRVVHEKCEHVRDRSGRIIRSTGIVHDITERMRTEEELKAAKAQAELYLDLMSHDINNMHQIALGYLEMAREMPGGKNEYLDKPVEVLQRSAQLIKNVRKLQKLHEGVFMTQEMDVSAILGEVWRVFGALPDKKVRLKLNQHRHCYVKANELIYDVFSNLVGNAVKHTGAGACIEIDLDLEEKEGRQYCRVKVEDNGPGIPDDFKVVIFNRALKGTTKAKGMGLGLYLVKSLVESYSGLVWVEDRVPGDYTKGVKFVVMLPAVEK